MQDDGDHPRMGRTDWWLLAGSLVAFGGGRWFGWLRDRPAARSYSPACRAVSARAARRSRFQNRRFTHGRRCRRHSGEGQRMPRFAVAMMLPAGMVGAASTGIYPHHAPTVGTGVGTVRLIVANIL